MDTRAITMSSHSTNATMSSITTFHRITTGQVPVWETYNTINKQSFFCINDDCGNIAAAGHLCVSCDSARGTPKCTECNYRHAEDGDTKCSICAKQEPMCAPEECPGCGCEMWGVLLGTNGYCGMCWQQRYGLLACCGSSSVAAAREECQMCGDMAAPGDSEESGWVCDECFQALDHHENCNETRDMCCCLRAQRRMEEVKPKTTGCMCDGSGLVCPLCNVEYHENCRGCGAFTNLGLGDYCSACYLPPPPQVPRHTSFESMRAEIAEIEARLLTKMTQAQKDDWTWILQRRRADLAQEQKEMWEQYDEDDLRKFDRQR